MGLKRKKPIKTTPGTGIEYDSLSGYSLLKRTLGTYCCFSESANAVTQRKNVILNLDDSFDLRRPANSSNLVFTGLQNLHHSQYLGPNSVPDVHNVISGLITAPTYQQKSRARRVDVRFVDQSHAFRIIPDDSTAAHDQESQLIDDIEATVEPYGKELVHIYFRIIHPAFPILHREVFLEKYARSYTEFSPALLATVYLLACGYWRFSEALADNQKPDVRKLQKLALDSLHCTMNRPKLSTVQATLLLSQYQTPDSTDVTETVKSRLSVQLIDLAYGLGLHLDSSTWEIPEWEIGLRRRLAWAVIVQDKWISLFSGRPSLVQLYDWHVMPLSADDFPDNTEDEQEGSSEVEKGRLVFHEMAALSVIVSDIMLAVFSAPAMAKLEQSDDRLGYLLETIKPLQIKLKEWFASLPESLKMETAASMKLSSVGYLRLAYLAVETCLHRHIVKTMILTPELNPNLLQICRNAAKERFLNSVGFLQRLQAQHLASFWYFTSSKCCALIYCFGQALQSVFPAEEEKELIAKKLKELRWTLKVNSEAGAAFMRQALNLLDTSVRILPSEATLRSPVETSPVWTETDNSITAPIMNGEGDLTPLNKLMVENTIAHEASLDPLASFDEHMSFYDLNNIYDPGNLHVEDWLS